MALFRAAEREVHDSRDDFVPFRENAHLLKSPPRPSRQDEINNQHLDETSRQEWLNSTTNKILWLLWFREMPICLWIPKQLAQRLLRRNFGLGPQTKERKELLEKLAAIGAPEGKVIIHEEGWIEIPPIANLPDFPPPF